MAETTPMEVRLSQQDLEQVRQMVDETAAPLVRQLEQARRFAVRLEQENAALAAALRDVVRKLPVTSTWAHETEARDHAERVLVDTMGADYLNGD